MLTAVAPPAGSSAPAGAEIESVWYFGLTWVEWVSVCGVLVTAVGFIITWIQLHRTRTAREAVADKVGEITQNQAAERISDLLPELRNILRQASLNAEKERLSALRTSLEKWNGTCERIIELLSTPRHVNTRFRRPGQQVEVDEAMILLFRSCQSKVTEALFRLEDSVVDLSTATQYARAAMRKCADRADGFTEKQGLEKVS